MLILPVSCSTNQNVFEALDQYVLNLRKGIDVDRINIRDEAALLLDRFQLTWALQSSVSGAEGGFLTQPLPGGNNAFYTLFSVIPCERNRSSHGAESSSFPGAATLTRLEEMMMICSLPRPYNCILSPLALEKYGRIRILLLQVSSKCSARFVLTAFPRV